MSGPSTPLGAGKWPLGSAQGKRVASGEREEVESRGLKVESENRGPLVGSAPPNLDFRIELRMLVACVSHYQFQVERLRVRRCQAGVLHSPRDYGFALVRMSWATIHGLSVSIARTRNRVLIS